MMTTTTIIIITTTTSSSLHLSYRLHLRIILIILPLKLAAHL